MKTVGVMIDDWKLPIFKEQIESAGYSYKECPGLTKNTLLLQVKTERLATLQPIIQRANKECAKWKRNKKLN